MNSKKIGNNYEREVARILSKWFTGNDKELVVWRNVHSGTVGTLQKKKGKSGENTSGDFQCLDSKYELFFRLFHIDSKSLKSIHLYMINPDNRKSCQLFQEWIKVTSDANGKIPMMMVKDRNDRKIKDFIVFPSSLSIKCSNEIDYSVLYEDKIWSFKIVNQEEFFKKNNWNDFLLI